MVMDNVKSSKSEFLDRYLSNKILATRLCSYPSRESFKLSNPLCMNDLLSLMSNDKSFIRSESFTSLHSRYHTFKYEKIYTVQVCEISAGDVIIIIKDGVT